MSVISETHLVFNVFVPAQLGVGSSSHLTSIVDGGMLLYVYISFIRTLGFRVLPVLVSRFFVGLPIASVAAHGSSVLYVSASTADECEYTVCLYQAHTLSLLCSTNLSFSVIVIAELRVLASASLPSGVHPCQPILGRQLARSSGADAVQAANP